MMITDMSTVMIMTKKRYADDDGDDVDGDGDNNDDDGDDNDDGDDIDYG